MKILIVDDDTSLLEQLKAVLEKQLYTIDTAADGAEALDRIFQGVFDVVVLDVMMPRLDGIAVLREIRQAGMDVPILMLSAKGDTDDRIQGLNCGADDYLAKPFSSGELLARIRALLRRGGGQADPVLQVQNILLDTVSRTVSKGGVALELTPREFAILEFLLYNKNRVVSRLKLTEHVWQDDFDPFSMSNFIDVHIKNLRRKIEDTPQTRIIQTLRGVGYMIKESER